MWMERLGRRTFTGNMQTSDNRKTHRNRPGCGCHCRCHRETERLCRQGYHRKKQLCTDGGRVEESRNRKVDGIILDLGVSSFQLDTPERGFTYRSEDAPLDMRMDKRQRLTARDIVNDYSEAELFRIIRDYGEDRFAKNIAKHIVQARKENRLKRPGNSTQSSVEPSR